MQVAPVKNGSLSQIEKLRKPAKAHFTFYCLISIWIAAGLLIQYFVFLSVPNDLKAGRESLLVPIVIALASLLISVAILWEIVLNYRVDLSDMGVSKPGGTGSRCLIEWSDVIDVRWEGGITFVGSKTSLTVSPFVFKDQREVYEYVRHHWETAPKRNT